MTKYDISVSQDEINHEYLVLLRGPGIDGSGRQYVFISEDRCATFLDAVNFAYRQGLRDGARRTDSGPDEFFVVSGTTPDNLEIRPEGWWARTRRRFGLSRR